MDFERLGPATRGKKDREQVDRVIEDLQKVKNELESSQQQTPWENRRTRKGRVIPKNIFVPAPGSEVDHEQNLAWEQKLDMLTLSYSRRSQFVDLVVSTFFSLVLFFTSALYVGNDIASVYRLISSPQVLLAWAPFFMFTYLSYFGLFGIAGRPTLGRRIFGLELQAFNGEKLGPTRCLVRAFLEMMTLGMAVEKVSNWTGSELVLVHIPKQLKADKGMASESV